MPPAEVPRLEAPRASERVVAEEIAKQTGLKRAIAHNENRSKDWARAIVSRAAAGDRITPYSLRSARQALGMEGRQNGNDLCNLHSLGPAPEPRDGEAGYGRLLARKALDFLPAAARLRQACASARRRSGRPGALAEERRPLMATKKNLAQLMQVLKAAGAPPARASCAPPRAGTLST